ncbi:MAG TPA: pantoate--beta-alanine ligase [Candidatus Limnocylindrales bacterium]|nr:pantoate--beta-alanine ligase [Candidatus Limnocylindrales bacterium]
MRIVRGAAAMRALSRRARSRRRTIGFVPTMGALHQGHISLIRRARRGHDRVAASIFVNPLQFGPREDFARYPRPIARDARLCRAAGVDWLFLPTARALYPPGSATRVVPGPLGSKWEGAARPGHFTGVLTVVLKLLQIVEPDTLILGQKDAQQAAVVGAMMRDLDLAARLRVEPTVRERDGLALSSRNAYLAPDQRLRAAGLNRALAAGRAAARAGARDARRIVAAARAELHRRARPDAVDYLALVDPRTFEPVRRLDRRALLIAAIRIGRTRLIDNLAVAP